MITTESYKKLARILRTNESVIRDLDARMSEITGLAGVLDAIIESNEWNMEKTLRRFDLFKERVFAEEVQVKLIDYVNKSEARLLKRLNGDQKKQPFGQPRVFSNFDGLIKEALAAVRPPTLWVLKKEKARQILEQNPPPNILKYFDYKDGKELLEKEKLEEVFSALRFMESDEWMHKTFDAAYKDLTPEDFEERNVEVIVLAGRWLEAGEKFVGKKRHNLSHLKELGVVFIIPILVDRPGELMRVAILLFHYLIEVEFYSSLFKLAAQKENFSERIISLLRGDVLEKPFKPDSGIYWLIIQRYLSKDNPNDSRLFIPHVNPEAIHWRKAEEALAKMDAQDMSLTLSFWKDLDWVGEFFPSREIGIEKLVSFDLVDATMSLVEKVKGRKYLYHQQEALWNKIFSEYLSIEQLENLIVNNLNEGFIHLK